MTLKDASSIFNSVAPGYQSSQKQAVILVRVNGQDVKMTSVEFTTSKDGGFEIQCTTKSTQQVLLQLTSR